MYFVDVLVPECRQRTPATPSTTSTSSTTYNAVRTLGGLAGERKKRWPRYLDWCMCPPPPWYLPSSSAYHLVPAALLPTVCPTAHALTLLSLQRTCAARSLHHLEPALFCFCAPTPQPLLPYFLFQPFSSSSSSTEFRIRRFSTSLVANFSSFVDVWIQVSRVSLLLLLPPARCCAGSLFVFPRLVCSGRYQLGHVYFRSTFTSLEGF